MKKSVYLFLLLLLIGSCLDRLTFDVGDLNNHNLVVMGSITDQPGPYEVKFFLTSNVDDDLLRSTPYSARHVYILDDAGNREELTSDLEAGVYQTSPEGMRGVVGRKYQLRVEALDGTVFESEPDELKPVASIDSLYWKWDAYSPIRGEPRYGFRIFMNTHEVEASDVHFRWRYRGTYKVETFPKLHTDPMCDPAHPDPLPCSGYFLANRSVSNSGAVTGILTSDGSPCTCCYCWVDELEPKPQLSDGIIQKGGAFTDVEVGYAKFDEWKFEFRKYLVTINQMSLTTQAFEFWKTIRDQKDGITSLFQPSFGKLPTNIHAVNSDKRALGFFYATAIASKTLLIRAEDAPIAVPAHSVDKLEYCPFLDACDKAWLNASRTPPPEWD